MAASLAAQQAEVIDLSASDGGFPAGIDDTAPVDHKRIHRDDIKNGSATSLTPSFLSLRTTSTPLSGVSDDRAQMEKERLARQAARQAQNGTMVNSNGSTVEPSIFKTHSDASGSSSAPLPEPLHASNGAKKSHNGVTQISGPAAEYRRQHSHTLASGRSTGHPLQSPGPFPTDEPPASSTQMER